MPCSALLRRFFFFFIIGSSKQEFIKVSLPAKYAPIVFTYRLLITSFQKWTKALKEPTKQVNDLYTCAI